ncbi:LINE-1 type transposase domain-containing protein 1 [Labeo rohita]|uniref:LINE-1 type transposase domain-containing protein 1 n=1 Tax=Labeo rohita TaxID=84645 RepID=A0ABQ8L9W6_LABRO|nr:LINE-1 type transposase domain-containing protein 1 [Labeo rohita]
MNKSTRTGGKQQTQVHHDRACRESSKMAYSETTSSQLTVESLVKELEKFRKDMTGEFVALLNISLEPIQSSIKSFGVTLTAQADTVNEMEAGLPEDIEGKKAREYVTNLLSELLADCLAEPPELDSVHRSLQPKPCADEPPRPFIIRFHRYIIKETVMRWSKYQQDISYKGHKIKLVRKRAAFNKIKSLLYKQGV